MNVIDKHQQSIIVPVYNGSKWIRACFDSILEQRLPPNLKLELCVCDDASSDNTSEMLAEWGLIFARRNIAFKQYKNETGAPKGVGFAKNKAVSVSNGAYLCFQDVDDRMLPHRIAEQIEKAIQLPQNTIIGGQFRREPESSTQRYTQWANNLPSDKLHLQIYTSHGPTLIMPTWFCHRSVFDRVGGFSEKGRGSPEDLIFFYKHLDLGGYVFRVDKPLIIYTYHAEAATFSVKESTIWQLRVKRLEEVVLPKWSKFTIWNAGKQGRKLYSSLSPANKDKVAALCDVDVNKIGRKYVPFDPVTRRNGRPLDIVHFKEAAAPFVICVKIDLTNGVFENNLATLHLQENVDYILFS